MNEKNMETIKMSPNKIVYWYNNALGIFLRLMTLKRKPQKIKNIME